MLFLFEDVCTIPEIRPWPKDIMGEMLSGGSVYSEIVKKPAPPPPP